MAQFGELFGAPKMRKESSDDQGDGERFEHGPLDLDSGVVRIRPLPRREKPADPEQ
ncbi:hypothetical protein [Kibdelosporangium phytohabitans]|uniref:hypothetical protein n=1 Tax=Kibdelosporangium phytohabitans TaxID=860235 RepID=UPI0012F72CAC|nr:hypothetical protein [Kibdelosporangium phytohabitans]MBE1469713.1 hypothetical protein [Kibdelosporangium phytohabitans]